MVMFIAVSVATSVLFAVSIPSTFASLKCQNEDGKDVDWVMAYKLPRLKHHSSLIEKGVAHLFLGPDSHSWTLSKNSITEKTSFLGKTLKSVFSERKNEDGFYILYNDEHPDDNVTYSRGHTKGVVAFDGETGFWLIHSVPKFPPFVSDSYSYPESGEVYGQSFLCISFKFDVADQIGDLLLYDDPFVYDFYLPDKLAKQLPSISAVVKNKHVEEKPWNKTVTLSSINKQEFLLFSKYKNFDEDLYSSLVAPHLKVDILTETWQNGPKKNKLHSDCSSDFTVENIHSLLFPTIKVSFNSTHDHSKLAVSKDPSEPWICIGDINRMTTQTKRGGGTACLKSAPHWKLYHSLVTSIESCSKRERKMYFRRKSFLQPTLTNL